MTTLEFVMYLLRRSQNTPTLVLQSPSDRQALPTCPRAGKAGAHTFDSPCTPVMPWHLPEQQSESEEHVRFCSRQATQVRLAEGRHSPYELPPAAQHWLLSVQEVLLFTDMHELQTETLYVPFGFAQ